MTVCGATDAGTAGRPLDTIPRSCHIMPTHLHRTLRNVDQLFDYFCRETDRETDRETGREMFGFGFVFFGLKKKRREPTGFSVKSRKTDRPHLKISHFRFTALTACGTGTSLCCRCLQINGRGYLTARQSSPEVGLKEYMRD